MGVTLDRNFNAQQTFCLYLSISSTLPVGWVVWLILLDEMCGFSILSPRIEAHIEIKLPQEWNEAVWINDLVLCDQEISICVLIHWVFRVICYWQR